MKQLPPKVLALTEEEANKLLQRMQDGTATLEERQDLIAIMHSYRELLDFVENADESWDDHVLEISHGWRKKKNPKKLK